MISGISTEISLTVVVASMRTGASVGVSGAVFTFAALVPSTFSGENSPAPREFTALTLATTRSLRIS